ncbi:MAG: IS1182 family transposase, partial [Candidatus Omnitrophica bacterium]|nr:IS1182 family transposase [Candidatus Omnitrophota bacterium]
MKYIKGYNRNQLVLFPTSVDDAIEQDNDVRLIDLFVESFDIAVMGFRIDHTENGRPAYHPKDFLKLYIYGYLNSIRSSRKLEKATQVNIEVMWLMKGLEPDHNTISNFRRDNPKAIKKVFRATVETAKNFDLIGGKFIAGDSTKLRAQNSKKNNFNKKKIDRHLVYIDNKLEEYNKKLQEADNDIKDEKTEDNITKIKSEIKKQTERKDKYEQLEKQLEETGDVQISTSDPDSRQMITRNNITEVAYNVQSTVDAKNNIPIDYKVTDTNDSKAMGPMLRRAKSILKTNNFTALYDKGYHTGSEFETADKLGINVLVSFPKSAKNAPNPSYNAEHFTYDKEKDIYICPQGNKLTTTGTLYKGATYNFKRYTTKSCKTCPVKEECSKAKYGKAIQRSEYQTFIENNKIRIENNKEYYKQRQAIVEHPYGTIKRQWGFS